MEMNPYLNDFEEHRINALNIVTYIVVLWKQNPMGIAGYSTCRLV